MTTGRILRNILLVLAATSVAIPTVAQYRVGDDGAALDANNRIGSGGYNTRRLAPVAPTADQIVTGNVTGGKAFRGRVYSGDQTAFRGSLGTDTSDKFTRDSSGAPTRGQPVATPGAASAYYSRDRTVAPPAGYRVSPYTQTLVLDPRAQRGAVDLQNNLPPSSSRIYDPSQPTELILSGPGAMGDGNTYLASPLYGLKSASAGSAASRGDPRLAATRAELRGLDPIVLADLSRQARENLVDVGSDEYRGLVAEAGARQVGPGAPVAGAAAPVEPGTAFVRPAGAEPAVPGLTGPVVTVKPAEEKVDRGDRKPEEAGKENAGKDIADPKGVVKPENDAGAGNEKQPERKQGPRADASGGGEAKNTQLQEMSRRWIDALPASKETGGRAGNLKLDAVALAPVGKMQAVEVANLSDGISQASVKTVVKDAESLVAQGKYLEALARYELAEAAAPNDATIALGRGNTELASGRYVAAEASIRRAIATEPGVLLAKMDLRKVMGDERLQTIVRELKLIAVDEKSGSNAPVLLAYIAYHTGNGSRAGELLDEAIRRSGGNDPTLSLLKARYTGDEASK